MKRKTKRIVTISAVSVAVVALVAAGVLYSRGFFGAAGDDSTTSYTVSELTTGTLESSVIGTGTLAAGGAATETAPLDLTVTSWLVKAGQGVKAGDALATVDTDALADTAAALEDEIEAIDSALGQLTATSASTQKLNAPVSGRVKRIFCSVGSDTAAVTAESGGLLLLSTDGKMTADCALTEANSAAVGDEVKVKVSGTTYTGLVEALSADGMTATVTLTDNGTGIGEAAALYNSGGTKLGEGTLEINRPYYVTATAGTVGDIYVDVNDKVSGRTSLVYLIGIPLNGDEYAAQAKERAEKAALLETAQALLTSGELTATQDGIVNTLTATEGKGVLKGEALLTLYTGGVTRLDVNVDELDIGNVKAGQEATVELDAVTGTTFAAVVESISEIGTYSNSVTNYKVTLKLEPAEQLKIGMNATATIIFEKHENALLLPMEALQALRGKQYVWLYTGTLPEDSAQDPGTYTEVTTGLSNDNFVEILSGLTAEDKVVIVRTKSTTANGNTRNGGMMFGEMTGGMPGGDGGNRPSGNFQPPSRD